MPDNAVLYFSNEYPYTIRNSSDIYVAIDESMWQNVAYYSPYQRYTRTLDFEAVIEDLQLLLKNVEASFAHSSIKGNARSILMNAIIQFKTLEFDQEAASHE